MERSGTRPDRMQSKGSVVLQPGKFLGDEKTSDNKERNNEIIYSHKRGHGNKT